MRFKLISQKARIRLSDDTDVWFPFQLVKLPSVLIHNPTISLVHKNASESLEQIKFRYPEDYWNNPEHRVDMMGRKYSYKDLKLLSALSVPVPDSNIDIDKRMFYIRISKQYVFKIVYDGLKDIVEMRASKVDGSPTAFTIQILTSTFEELDFVKL